MKFKTLSRGLLALLLLAICLPLVAQVSKPIVPSQPDRMIYGPGELALFKSYTRESYEKDFGVQAPPFDPAKRPKYWFDSTVDTSDPENVVTYRVLGADKQGKPLVRTVALTAAEAASVNLPGRRRYPPYVVAPTKACAVGPSDDCQILNPEYLSTRAEAEKMAAELGCAASSVVELQLSGPFRYFYPADEPRRQFNVCGGQSVGLLLREKYAYGVGAPGFWEAGAWKPTMEPDGQNDTRAPAPVPIRDLLSNESLTTGFSGIVQITRLDKQVEADKSDGKFLPEDRALLRAIAQKLGLLQ